MQIIQKNVRIELAVSMAIAEFCLFYKPFRFLVARFIRRLPSLGVLTRALESVQELAAVQSVVSED